MPILAAVLVLLLGGDERSRGIEALPEVLRRVESRDPDTRVRARRLARAIVTDYLKRKTPKGMRLIPGRIDVSAKGVRVVGGFYLGRTEVTRGAFRPGATDPKLPVTQVTLREARAFAKAKGMRLPTRAELMYATTGGGRFRFPWGDRYDPARANTRDSGRGRAEPVGSRKPSVHGIADLLGNVAEWTETKEGGKFAVVGGSYRTRARSRFVTYRLAETARLPDVGFRLAKSLPPIASRSE